MNKLKVTIALCFLFVSTSYAQSPIDGVDARSNPAEFSKQLNSPDADVRRRSAEALAQLAATDQRKLVEGYQLQENNKEVRLALDWALYRMGRSASLFRIVDELDSGRHEQSIGYLSQLDSADVLYPFLKRTNNAPRINAGLLKALARIPDVAWIENFALVFVVIVAAVLAIVAVFWWHWREWRERRQHATSPG